MKITVVTAVYNRAQTIVDCLDSFDRQTYPDTEHLVVDGASTDTTLQLLKRRAADKRVVVSEPDGGIYDALNKGIARASGDVVGLLHSDDVFTNDTVLATVADHFARNDVDVLFANCSFFANRDSRQVVRYYNSNIFSPERLKFGIMPAHTTMFVRKSVYDAVGPYRTDYRIAADFEFCIRLFQAHGASFAHIDEEFVSMQVGGASTGSLAKKVQLNREILRACADNGIRSNWLYMALRYAIKASQVGSRRATPRTSPAQGLNR